MTRYSLTDDGHSSQPSTHSNSRKKTSSKFQASLTLSHAPNPEPGHETGRGKPPVALPGAGRVNVPPPAGIQKAGVLGGNGEPVAVADRFKPVVKSDVPPLPNSSKKAVAESAAQPGAEVRPVVKGDVLSLPDLSDRESVV